MNFTSFNPIQIQQSNITHNQPLALKQGQVLHGTIKKLYPDQLAEIQVGNQKLFAKLETPLKAGDSHFYQVTNISPQVQLKVVTGPMNGSSTISGQIYQLLDSMKLPKSTDVMQIVSHFIKEQIPISKEQIIQAQGWLKGQEGILKQNAITALQKMIQLKMPFTKDVFQAMINGSKTSGIVEDLQTFSQILVKDTSVSESMKTTLLQSLASISNPLNVQKGGLLLARAVQTLLNESESVANKLQALNLLKESSIVPKQATLSNWIQTQTNVLGVINENHLLQNASKIINTILNLNSSNASNILYQVKALIENDSVLSQTQKNDLYSFINRFETLPKHAQNVDQYIKQFNEFLLKTYLTSITTQQISQNSNGPVTNRHLLSLMNQDAILNETKVLSNLVKIATETNQPHIQSLHHDVEQHLKMALDGNTIQQAMKSILKSLGLSYETALNQNFSEVEHLSEQLKPQLLSMLKDGLVSPSLKEAAETLLARMNGMQLLSGENGHQHQIVMQIPLHFFGKSMDATLQWNGKMNENGEIDSNYARILFYLDMESLNETVIDMQVQNRIVTITLYNEYENLQILAEPLQKLLKDQLSDKGYYLSGVFYKTFEESNKGSGTEKGTKLAKVKDEDVSRFTGVDIRV